MPTWPATLPDPVWDSIEIGPPQGAFQQTPMDVGPSKRRRRTSAVTRPASMVFAPVTAQMLTEFEVFYMSDLSCGAFRFDMAHPFTDVIRSWRFVEDGGYQTEPIGDDAFEISVSLELFG